MTFWGILRTFWGSVENLRPEDLVYLLCIFMTFWGLSGPFEEFWKIWGPDALRTLKIFQELLMTSCKPIEDLMPLRISMTFQDIEDFANLITYWGLWGGWLIFEDFEVALNTFCGPMRISRDSRPFWGNRGDFEDHLRTWGLRTLGTFCAFSWLFEDFLDPLRNFGRPEDLIFSERWRIFQELLMTSCEPIEDLMPLRISMTFQDIEDFANLITYWGLWGRW